MFSSTAVAGKEESKDESDEDDFTYSSVNEQTFTHLDAHKTRSVGCNELLKPYVQPNDVTTYVQHPVKRSAHSSRYVPPKPGELPVHAPNVSHAEQYKKQINQAAYKSEMARLPSLQRKVAEEFEQAASGEL